MNIKTHVASELAIILVLSLISVPSALSAHSDEGAVLVGEPSRAEGAKIQPGASMTDGENYCTLNWVFDGIKKLKGRVFVGTAAHCVEEVGQKVMLSAGTLGEPVLTIGKVVFMGADPFDGDYALIQVAKKNHDLVDPALRGYPEVPAGVATAATAEVGDHIQFSGNGAGFHAHEVTREKRFGILHTITEGWWSAAGPITNGDSGGPAADVTDGNKALGIVTVACAGPGCTGGGGPTVVALLREAADAGLRVKLRTVRRAG